MTADYDSVPVSSSGSASKFRLVTYVLLVVAVLLFIAGAVMLGIGIGKINDCETISTLFSFLNNKSIFICCQRWARRYREYKPQMRSEA